MASYAVFASSNELAREFQRKPNASRHPRRALLHLANRTAGVALNSRRTQSFCQRCPVAGTHQNEGFRFHSATGVCPGGTEVCQCDTCK
jgi:hypothetical protein